MRSRYIIISAVCLLLLIAGHCSGQRMAMQHYTADDGLPSDMVYVIYRDSKGFLWFCTDKGIARYNGTRFEQFTIADGLADNEIFNVQEDGYGRLWLATYNGRLCFYKDGIFHTAANTPFLRYPRPDPLINYMRPQYDGSICITSRNTTSFLNIAGEKISPITVPSVDTRYGNYVVKRPGNQYILHNGDRGIVTDSSGRIKGYIPEAGFRFSIPLQNQLYVKIKDSIYSVSIRGDYTPFIRTGRMIDEYTIFRNRADGTFFLLTPLQTWINDSIPVPLQTRVTSVTTDIAGNYWLSTLGEGVYRLGPNITAITSYSDAYKYKVIHAAEAGGQIVFTTQDNSIYKLAAGRIECLYRSNEQRPSGFYMQRAHVVDDHLNYYNFDDRGFFLPDIRTVSAANFHSRRQTTRNTGVTLSVHFNNSFYISDRRVIVRSDEQAARKGCSVNQHIVTGNAADASQRKFALVRDGNRSLWYSTLNDLYRIVRDSAVLQPQFRHTGFRQFIVCGPYLAGITHDNALLVCSNFERADMRIDTISAQGCIWDRFYRLDSNHVLVSTSNLHRVLTLSGSRGRPSVQIVENPSVPVRAEYICPYPGGCCFFKDGAVYLVRNPEFFSRIQPPVVLFTGIATAKRRYQQVGADMHIPYGEAQKIVIRFTALSFGGQQLSYEYALSAGSADDHWQPTGTEEINLLSPRYGDYTLKIRARTLSSGYSAPAAVRLHILKPYWAEAWFIVSMIVLALLILAAGFYYFSRLRLYLEQRRHNNELRFLKSEYKAMNALMNPHFIFNSLNNIQGLINRDDKLAANRYLNYFSTMVRQNMHNIAEDLISLQRELDLLHNYLKLEQLRFDHKFTYGIIVEPDVDTETVMIAPLLIQPLVENAIRHGLLPKRSADSFVRLRIYRDEASAVCIEIRDNGIGLGASKAGAAHQSFGLENIRRRIAQLGALHHQQISFMLHELKDEAGAVAGTVAVVCIKDA